MAFPNHFYHVDGKLVATADGHSGGGWNNCCVLLILDEEEVATRNDMKTK